VKLLLLHSPLTGPSVWQNLAPLLQARGFDVLVPDYRHVLMEGPLHYEKIARELVRQSTKASTLIVHSGAGALVPALASAIPLRAAVFTDALLPHPGRCWLDTVPEIMDMRLRGLVIDGYLPPWNCWWPKEALEAMLPDTAMRDAFIADLQPLPLSYFEEPAPDNSLPRKLPCAYLQLSPGYDAEAAEARSMNWPTRRMNLNHLAILTHPEEVAGALKTLSAEL
jgi:pimeloyl-ACP methyl ester carboxylesterase